MAQANTPQPPYYAAIFSSKHTGAHEDYDDDTETILELAKQHPGFLGVEAAGDDDLSIAVSYWESDESIRAFKELAEHLVIQEREAAKPTTRATRCEWRRWSATTDSMCSRLC